METLGPALDPGGELVTGPMYMDIQGGRGGGGQTGQDTLCHFSDRVDGCLSSDLPLFKLKSGHAGVQWVSNNFCQNTTF